QSADNQANERFDKALTRLASQRPEERMTGVSGLTLFLSDNAQLLQKQALVFLVNALSLETDEQVQGAILDALAALQTGKVFQVALDEGLRAAIERNRSLMRSIMENWPNSVLKKKKEIIAKVAHINLNPTDNDIPVQVLAALSTEQYLSLLN